jgi:hypothetical protein
MNRKKIEIIITLGLIPVLIFILHKNLSGINRSRAAVYPQLNQETPMASSAETMDQKKGPSWGRDPFTFGKTKGAGGDLVLNGIVWDEQFPSAIINGNVVKVADELDGNRVIEIRKEKVVLDKAGVNYELHLWVGDEE